MSSVTSNGPKKDHREQNDRLRILKFGGTSVATAERRRHVAEIVTTAQRRGPVIVVTSALGSVTDLLLDALDGALAGEDASRRAQRLDRIRDLHTEDPATRGTEPDADVLQNLEEQLDALKRCLDGVALLQNCPTGTRHHLLAFGERLALPWVCAALRHHDIDAFSVDGGELLVTEDSDVAGTRETLDPAVDTESSRRTVRRWWSDVAPGRVPVVSGFVARDGQGHTTTLGRGASDLTATLLGGFLEAEGVDIWTDVDGVLSASPQWVKTPRKLDFLSYSEAAEIARLGARVLHPRTLEPLMEAAIPVRIRNTMARHGSGTCVGSGLNRVEPGDGGHVRAVTALTGNALLRLSGDWYRPLLEVLDDLKLEPLLWVHGNSGRSASLVLPRDAADAACRALRRHQPFCGKEVQLECCPNIGLVAAIGSLSRTPHCLGRLLDSLQIAEIQTLGAALPCPTEASQEHATVVLVHENDVPAAVRCLHRDLIEGKNEFAETSDDLTPSTPYSAPLRRAQIRQEPSSRLL